MRILIAPDKFKHSLGALDVAQELAAGLRETFPAADLQLLPLADGGEGTAEVIHRVVGGEWVDCETHNAMGRGIAARYLFVAGPSCQTIAVMEMSATAGLARLGGENLDPDIANTFGVGEMIIDALRRGAEEIVIGLGGSATNDGGFGMARVLGFRFEDADGREITGAVSSLSGLHRIIPPRRKGWTMRAAADVCNPLLGACGATVTYALQKGARPEQVAALESALSRLADVVRRDLGCDFRTEPGAGAAGGLGFGLMTFCGATIQSGFDLVVEFVGLEAAVRAADVIITGEGNLDLQTLAGKVPAGVSQLARRYGKPVFAVAGLAIEDPQVRRLFDDVRILATPPITRGESMARCAELLRAAGRDLGVRLARERV